MTKHFTLNDLKQNAMVIFRTYNKFKMLETFEQVFKGVFLEYWSHGVLEY